MAASANAFLAARLLRADNTARALLRSAWVGEIGKLLLTALLFGAIFASIRPLSAAAVFGGFISAQLVIFGAPLFGGVSARYDAVAAGAEEKDESGAEIIVYYFHGTTRCKTCRTIEAYAQEAIEGGYRADLESGRLAWKVVNMEAEGNEHFAEDFGLVSSSVVVVELKGDQVARHQVLQEVWTLVRDKPRFIEYVQRSIGDYLKS